jgi:hypothetical protein
MICEACGKEHHQMVLHARCHPESPTWAIVNSEHEAITITCAQCGEHVVTLSLKEVPIRREG